jgi:hypothetical protein
MPTPPPTLPTPCPLASLFPWLPTPSCSLLYKYPKCQWPMDFAKFRYSPFLYTPTPCISFILSRPHCIIFTQTSCHPFSQLPPSAITFQCPLPRRPHPPLLSTPTCMYPLSASPALLALPARPLIERSLTIKIILSHKLPSRRHEPLPSSYAR